MESRTWTGDGSELMRKGGSETAVGVEGKAILLMRRRVRRMKLGKQANSEERDMGWGERMWRGDTGGSLVSAGI